VTELCRLEFLTRDTAIAHSQPPFRWLFSGTASNMSYWQSQ